MRRLAGIARVLAVVGWLAFGVGLAYCDQLFLAVQCLLAALVIAVFSATK